MPSISRRLHVHTLFVAVGLTLAAAPHLRAQDTSRTAERSTLAGVYTQEQAGRGRNLFLGSCKSCHAPESQTGANFARLWMGKPLLELFRYVSQNMPENDPGSLAPEVNADIIAYLLQLNAMPAGKAELMADTTALRAMRVESKDTPKPGAAPAPSPTRRFREPRS